MMKQDNEEGDSEGEESGEKGESESGESSPDDESGSDEGKGVDPVFRMEVAKALGGAAAIGSDEASTTLCISIARFV